MPGREDIEVLLEKVVAQLQEQNQLMAQLQKQLQKQLQIQEQLQGQLQELEQELEQEQEQEQVQKEVENLSMGDIGNNSVKVIIDNTSVALLALILLGHNRGEIDSATFQKYMDQILTAYSNRTQ